MTKGSPIFLAFETQVRAARPGLDPDDRDPAVASEGDLIARVDDSAGLVEPGLSALLRQPDGAAFDQGGGQTARLRETRAPQPDIDAHRLTIHSAHPGESRDPDLWASKP